MKSDPFSTHFRCCLMVPSSGGVSHDHVEESDLVYERLIFLKPALVRVFAQQQCSSERKSGGKKKKKEKYSKPCLVEILYFCNIVQCL